MISGRYSRQSFLGPDSEEFIARTTIAVVGLGGGGSHVVQQLAHLGFQRYVIYDYDRVEESNLNRLVGATVSDSLAQTPKLHLAKIMIFGLQPRARVSGFSCKWQDYPEPLRECQIVIGCLDSYKAREELEIACRRYLMHYIDIGMDVHGKDQSVIGGQVILSSPGSLCMKCMGFLTDETLGKEAAQYGNAGVGPQVIWSNGVLASTAVGLAVDLVKNWTRKHRLYAWLVNNGNENTLTDSLTLRIVQIPHAPTSPRTRLATPCSSSSERDSVSPEAAHKFESHQLPLAFVYRMAGNWQARGCASCAPSARRGDRFNEVNLSGEVEAQTRKRRALDAIKRILLRESLNQPLIVIFEDLHWVDEESQAFLNLLADSIGTARILLLVNYRPEYRHEWGHKTYYTQLRLDPLGKCLFPNSNRDWMLSGGESNILYR